MEKIKYDEAKAARDQLIEMMEKKRLKNITYTQEELDEKINILENYANQRSDT